MIPFSSSACARLEPLSQGRARSFAEDRIDILASVFQRLLVSGNTGKRKFPRDREGRKEMRLDKYLKVSRLIKRRTVANEACDAGRVLVNDKPAKASQIGRAHV